MNIWTYWEGPKPAYIDICLKSIAMLCKNNDHIFTIVTPETVEKLLGDSLNKNYLNIPTPGPKANAIRAALLANYGGWWWDADTIGLRDPSTVVNKYPDTPVLCSVWNKQPLRILNGYIYMKPGCEEAKEWLRRVNYSLKYCYDNAIIPLELGEKILTPLLQYNPAIQRVSRDTFLPIDIDSSVKLFFEPGNPQQYIQDHTVCYGLNHSWFMYHKSKEMTKTPEQYKTSNLLIHRLLTLAEEKL